MNADERAEKVAALRAEADALEREEPKEYPKWIHQDGKPSVLVGSPEEEKAVRAGAASESSQPASVAASEVVEEESAESDEDESAPDKPHRKAGRKK